MTFLHDFLLSWPTFSLYLAWRADGFVQKIFIKIEILLVWCYMYSSIKLWRSGMDISAAAPSMD